MFNLFAIIIIVFIGFLLLNFKRSKLKNLINIKNLYSKNLKNKKKKNIKYASQKNSFYFSNEAMRYSNFYKKDLRNKMVKLFESKTEDKLKALKIAEELADKSTLPILRKGLRDTSPEVVAKSAALISNFK